MKKFFFLIFMPWFCFAGSIGEDNNAFALGLFSQMDEKNENVAFSPYGIFSNLALLYCGAMKNTAQEIKNVLHISTTEEKFTKAFQKHFTGLSKKTEFGYELTLANALFPHQGTHFLTRFKDLATQTFDAQLRVIDYEKPDSAVETINRWVSQQTKGKIQDLVSEKEVDPSTRLIVANAVYFQGNWVYPLQKDRGFFFSPDKGKQEIETLRGLHTLPYHETSDLQCLGLPFSRHGTDQPFLECILILPKENTLSQTEQSLTPQKLDELFYHLEPTGINAEIPKFCFSHKLQLDEALKKMGMKEAFTYQADFSKIDGMKDLYLNAVLHETYFSFHEDGVTAASATTSHIGVTAAPPQIEHALDFIADHPFLFFIVDYHSRAILFMGRVTNPEVDECHDN